MTERSKGTSKLFPGNENSFLSTVAGDHDLFSGGYAVNDGRQRRLGILELNLLHDRTSFSQYDYSGHIG